MPRLLDYLAPLVKWLYALSPELPQALFVSLVFFTVWLLRKLAPNQWEGFANLIGVKSDDTSWWQNELRALWQMLPAAIIGTIYGVLGTGGELGPTLKATLLSLIAPFVHRIAKRYRGELGQPKDPGGPSSRKPVGLAVVALLVAGCSSGLPTVGPTHPDPTCSDEAYRKQSESCAAAAAACVLKGGTDAECDSLCDKVGDEWSARCQ